MDDGELLLAVAAASSECSSGCQSGWTTYLDDHSSSRSRGTARSHRKPHSRCDHYYSEEDDLSMISDASSGPRQQCSAGNDAAEERRGRRVDAASPRRRQSKKAAAAAAASLLEDTASSPAFFGYSKATRSGDANGYAYADDDEPMTGIGNAADFSCAFSATTGFKSSTFNGTPLDGYLQMHCSPVAAQPVPATARQVRRDAGETTKRW